MTKYHVEKYVPRGLIQYGINLGKVSLPKEILSWPKYGYNDRAHVTTTEPLDLGCYYYVTSSYVVSVQDFNCVTTHLLRYEDSVIDKNYCGRGLKSLMLYNKNITFGFGNVVVESNADQDVVGIAHSFESMNPYNIYVSITNFTGSENDLACSVALVKDGYSVSSSGLDVSSQQGVVTWRKKVNKDATLLPSNDICIERGDSMIEYGSSSIMLRDQDNHSVGGVVYRFNDEVGVVIFDYIALDADLHRQGLGSILVRYAKHFVETIGGLAFCFNTVIASGFYEKLGAKPSVEYQDFVKNTMEQMVLIKSMLYCLSVCCHEYSIVCLIAEMVWSFHLMCLVIYSDLSLN